MIAGWEWSRPVGLALLVLPVLLLAVARRQRPPAQPVGTLDLWREVAESSPTRGTSGRAWPPLSTLLIALGLALGALALAGPQRARAAGARAWRVVVDRSPSMYLPAGGAGATRLDLALAELERLLAEHTHPGDALDWFDGSRGRPAPGGERPAEWSRAPRSPLLEPRWSSFDGPGTLWVTDAAPGTEPRAAGYAAAGGPPVPGAVAVDDDGRLLLWDGDSSSTEVGPPAARSVSISEELPAPVRELAGAWAAARGLSTGPAAGADLRLECSRCERPRSEPVTAGRDGWSASGEAVLAGAELADSEPWLSAGDLRLVTWRPGRVDLAWPGMSHPAGDPAAFAVSWSELLDRALPPPPGVVSIAERAGAGPLRSRAPSGPGGGGEGSPGSATAAWLALAAALVVGLGLALRA